MLQRRTKKIFGLHHLKNWIESKDNGVEFIPLWLTVKICCRKSGKSVLINSTLITSIRWIFQRPDSMLVMGPTRSAAFNVGGKACHHGFCIPLRLNLGESVTRCWRNFDLNLNGLLHLRPAEGINGLRDLTTIYFSKNSNIGILAYNFMLHPAMPVLYCSFDWLQVQNG